MVEKETVPVERVRLDKETVRDDVTVNEEVRKENIETDGDTRRCIHPARRGPGVQNTNANALISTMKREGDKCV